MQLSHLLQLAGTPSQEDRVQDQKTQFPSKLTLALGDIGQHFPDTDVQFKGADSRVLLKHVYQLILDRGYALNNADITVACERPKLAKYNLEMRQSIADVLDVDVTQISVKATTTEKLGFTGRQEGILATATVLVSYQAK